DYVLFVVSRFREEIAEGYDTEAAVRRSVITAGRTVVFSAVLIIVASASLLVLPQGFVKSLTYAIFAAVGLAALLSITLLPACLGVLGTHVDALGVRTLLRVPFFRNWQPMNWWLNFLAEKTQKTKTRAEVEAGFWGRLVNFVMKRPMVFAVPIVIGMILLIIPLGKLSFGGMSEKYLPPDNSARVAQEQFDQIFPGFRTEKLTLVIESDSNKDVTDQQVAEVRNKAMAISGFVEPDKDPAKMWKERPELPGASKDKAVRVIENGLVSRDEAAQKIKELRNIAAPKGLTLMVGGTPALEQDSIHALVAQAPLMLVILLTTTTLLMFLAFGSLVLPLKAAVMSTLTLGSTMGILTWIFVDGHFSGLLNFTPTPLMVVIIALVVAVGYGLATDYEVFLVSRMVEARESGMSTAEAIRIGTATTGRLITAAALILAVVAGSFVFSDLVMMKYLAFGLMAALLLDATVVRMFLVPSVMKLLGDDCWWAPRWMKRLQNRLGLGEINLPAERKRPMVRGRTERSAVRRGERPPAAARVPAATKPRKPHDPTHPSAPGSSGPRTGARPERRPASADTPSAAGTTRMRSAGSPEPQEPTTTRFSAQRNAAPKRAPGRERPPQTSAAPPPEPQPARGEDREIESWLSELRGPTTSDRPADPRSTSTPKPPSDPSAGRSRSKPVPTERPGGQPPADEDPATTAIPTGSRDANDPDVATEKLNARGRKAANADRTRQRRSGTVSAQDLLRRERRS
ncbi:MAG: MMPL family transporter, partial [Mycobacterium sp.]